MNEIPSDSNAFNILSGLQAWQLRREVISSATIENDDKALCVSLCVSVTATMREREARVAGLSPWSCRLKPLLHSQGLLSSL